MLVDILKNWYLNQAFKCMNKIFNQHENIIWGINVRVINRNSYIFHILLPLSIFIWQKFRQYYVVKPKLFQIRQNWQQSKPTLEMLTHWTPSILPSNEVSFGLFLSFYHIYIISKTMTSSRNTLTFFPKEKRRI